MADPWVDPCDPAVALAVSGGGTSDCTLEVITVVSLASDLLTPLTGYLVHPAGHTKEDFAGQVAYPQTHYRLTPLWQPVETVDTVTWIHNDGTEELLTDGWTVFQWRILISASKFQRGSVACWPQAGDRMRVEYHYGSTITGAAARACQSLAHEFWLAGQGLACALPERVTSVNREGLSFTMIDPQTYLDKGLVGIPAVDTFLATVNRSKAQRPAGIYTPTMPPGVPAGRLG